MTVPRVRRVRIDEWGDRRRGNFVACYHEAARRRFVVEWYVEGKPRRKTFPHMPGEKAAARRAAAVYGQELSAVRGGTTLERNTAGTTMALYERYVTAMEAGWRPATRRGNAARWKLWSAYIKPSTSPELVTEDSLDDFHAQLRALGISPNQARSTFGLLRAVYRLGLRRGWVTCAAPLTYRPRFAKNERGEDPEEYSPAEWARLLAALDQGRSHDWRVLVALLLAGSQGQRINSITHLQVDDFRLAADPSDPTQLGTITWAAAWMKQGVEYIQPLTPAGLLAYRLAMQWRERMGYTGHWLLPAPRWKRKDAPVVYQTLSTALLRTEQRAGVQHRPYRGFHGGRRMVAENVYEGTGGDMLAAAAWLGDRDVKQMKKYLKRREQRLERAAEAASAASSAALGHTRNHTRTEVDQLEPASE